MTQEGISKSSVDDGTILSLEKPETLHNMQMYANHKDGWED